MPFWWINSNLIGKEMMLIEIGRLVQDNRPCHLVSGRGFLWCWWQSHTTKGHSMYEKGPHITIARSCEYVWLGRALQCIHIKLQSSVKQGHQWTPACTVCYSHSLWLPPSPWLHLSKFNTPHLWDPSLITPSQGCTKCPYKARGVAATNHPSLTPRASCQTSILPWTSLFRFNHLNMLHQSKLFWGLLCDNLYDISHFNVFYVFLSGVPFHSSLRQTVGSVITSQGQWRLSFYPPPA